MTPSPIDELATARAAAARELERTTEELVKAIADELRAGREVNVSAIARDADLARQTIYNRLAELGVQP